MSSAIPEGFNDEILAFNEEAKANLVADAERERLVTIQLVAKAVKKFVAYDTALLRRVLSQPEPMNESVSFYTLDQYLPSPQDPRESVRTLSILLAPNEEIGQNDGQRLRVFVPVSPEIVFDDSFDVSEIDDEPPFVIMQVIRSDGVENNSVISREGVRHFIPEDITGEQMTEDDIDGIDDFILNALGLRVDTGMPIAAKLREDIINRKTIHQRHFVLGQPGTIDE